MLVVVASLDLQASQEREVRREMLAVQVSLCQVPLDVLGILGSKVNQGLLDLQASPVAVKAALLASLVVLARKEREVTQESRVRKVRESCE